jgi:hypothetical protein
MSNFTSQLYRNYTCANDSNVLCLFNLLCKLGEIVLSASDIKDTFTFDWIIVSKAST